MYKNRKNGGSAGRVCLKKRTKIGGGSKISASPARALKKIMKEDRFKIVTYSSSYNINQ
jgi:hypothetical protein